MQKFKDVLKYSKYKHGFLAKVIQVSSLPKHDQTNKQTNNQKSIMKNNAILRKNQRY